VLNDGLRGFPIVGDFDGDGRDDLAVYQSNPNLFIIDLAYNGFTGADASVSFGFFGTTERPVAADMNADGVDDLGLFVRDRNGVTGGDTAEWFFLISRGTPVTGKVNTLTHSFKPGPFGTDLYIQYGDKAAAPTPVVGNFDPPVGASASTVSM